ncbi:hypothetical protein GCM10011390_28310 [Aureimonas endophytica]|uniref:DUF2147 domain-containing protein n=1 Tax=Aureimonas endophytica TaxID=2027858 RepID=A0A916ZRA5_9HYPH|nr:DUF2147 domain-containing protein [Aureimonas endophytica]GGE07600.1 hypothetical protein GCM10011390_28310 [Aureimonas endophytica]
MLRSSLAALCLLSLGAGSALAEEPILGQWRSPGGRIVEVKDCGGQFCATVLTGQHKGKSVGTLSGKGGEYRGTVTDPRDDRDYAGTAKVEGSRLVLEGCALKVFCRKQSWTRA